MNRSFNEAAHKLGYVVGQPATSAHDAEMEATRKRFEALADSNRDVIAHGSRAVLALGALGVVYGDLGTSPLYTDQAIFTQYKATAHITAATVLGTASLIFWALMIIVSIKYAGFIMRAHNRGDGGIMALTSLLRRNKVVHGTVLVTLGIFGAALFFGDGMVTPAISVLGAIQGVQVATPDLAHLVVPLSVAILLGLFILQRFGSGTIGWLFGPILLAWFLVIGLIGLNQVVKEPGVFQALSPTWAVRFFIDHGAAGYLVLGGVVLAITGAEALYADRGHFGAGPIRLGWFGLALPALVLNYLDQGVFILHHPSLAKDENTFNPLLPNGPALGSMADGRARRHRHGHRFPGRDLRLVLRGQASH
jgi:KUP system potassium uptake protein